ncbi:MAG: enoyl-CoA hydratase/isomerase family protein [Myxococcales bacterium]
MKHVVSRVAGKVGIIELHNPPHQFMTTRMVRELDELTERWEQDERVRAIVITGAPGDVFITHFSVDELSRSAAMAPEKELPAPLKRAVTGVFSGIDVAQRWLEGVPALRKVLESRAPGALRPLFSLSTIHRVFARLERMNKVVICAINGTTMGGGCELTLACDYRLMAEGDYVIGLVEVLGGIIPGAGGTQRLAATVGRAKALEMMLDGAVLSPREAERAGLITRAVPKEKLLDEALALAARMATRSPMAVGGAKRAARVGASLPLDDGLAFERLAFVACGLHPDAKRHGLAYLSGFRAGKSAREIFDELRKAIE